jgi:hypothetical protein
MPGSPSGMPPTSRRPISTEPQPKAPPGVDREARDELRQVVERLRAAPPAPELEPPVVFRA